MKTLKEIFAYREMIFSLVRKDLRGRYKGSVLGFLWTFINPLFQLIIYTFVFSVVLRSDIDKFYLYLFVALIPWIFFQSAISGGSTSILSQKDLVKKIYFPREVLPISYVCSCFMNMLFSFIIIFIVVIFSGVGINLTAVFCLPIIMLVEFIMCLGAAMIASAVTVFFRDMEHILSIVTMAWLYLTPILYSTDMIPDKLKPIYSFNPMTPVVDAYRDILYYRSVPSLSTLLWAFALGVAVLLIGCLVFGKLKKHFVEEL